MSSIKRKTSVGTHSKMQDRIREAEQLLKSHIWVEYKSGYNVRGNHEIVRYCHKCGCINRAIKTGKTYKQLFEVGNTLVKKEPYCQLQHGWSLSTARNTVVRRVGTFLFNFQHMTPKSLANNLVSFGDIYEANLLLEQLNALIFKNKPDLEVEL